MHHYRLPDVPFSPGSETSGYPPRLNDTESTMTRESAAEPLIPSQLDDEEVVFDAEEETQTQARGKGKGKERDVGEWIPYAHRDIKPGYVPLSSWFGRLLIWEGQEHYDRG
jgi:hypothetical protein